MTKTEQEIEKIILPVIEKLGYELYDVEFLKESSEWFLRIYIEKENHTIDLDDCEKVSDAVGELLDRVDPISQAYHLEVSSCGNREGISTSGKDVLCCFKSVSNA